ncbi:MAG: nucleotidyltransferase family protein [Ruminococcus sp.]|uniref:nucleotidyltransferase domain-containing protein n=1 Tax=Ruminococcus sp. TaxID=41978 RepID=UPI0025ED0C9F|nr:nucleotidyltransferase family protein [Ruminococcus sp.]MCR4794059.1 nucleotidyltransferase family protein [Ruminococcus sp.]
MEKSEFRKNAEDMIYLTACAINGITPKQERINTLDMPKLFEVCQNHILTACTAYALESVGIKGNDFSQAKEKAIRKNILLDAERAKVLRRLEDEKIWYMPLKGAIMKDWYPKLGMRQMSDNDILCDGEKRADIKALMLDMGFTCEHYGENNDDAYFKPPVCNFEMHNELFTGGHIGKLHSYYDDVKSRLIKDKNNGYGYHFSDEDFYIYITAHEYKHFTSCGTGVRSLLDTYIFMRRFKASLDLDYIAKELERLDIADFERDNRELAMKVFSLKPLTDAEKQLLDYYILSGVYGTLDNRVKNDMKYRVNGSKLGYLRYRLFPPADYVRASVPWAKKSRLLLPAAYVYRFFRGASVNRKGVKKQLKQIGKK